MAPRRRVIRPDAAGAPLVCPPGSIIRSDGVIGHWTNPNIGGPTTFFSPWFRLTGNGTLRNAELRSFVGRGAWDVQFVIRETSGAGNTIAVTLQWAFYFGSWQLAGQDARFAVDGGFEAGIFSDVVPAFPYLAVRLRAQVAAGGPWNFEGHMVAQPRQYPAAHAGGIFPPRLSCG